MKIAATVLCGFVLTLLVFVAGAATTAVVLTGEFMPTRASNIDTTDLWTAEAVRVNTSTQDFQRLPSRQLERDAASEENRIDRTTTAAIVPEQEPIDEGDAREVMNPAHIEWCRKRYRSYDPDDNAYNSYSGERRQCVSPYNEPAITSEQPEDYALNADDDWFAPVATANAGARSDMALNSDHVRECFNRYRSYDPSDNTYQPYGGGSRRQCL